MKTLGVDTSTPVNAVALCEGGRILVETHVDCGRAHAERLMATADWVLGEAGIGLEAVGMLAVSVGPGSFTGLRIGVAAWKGLALARGLPLAGVPTLDAMTRIGAFHDAIVCPMLDAKMGEVFAAAYRFGPTGREKLTADCVLPVDQVLAMTPVETIFFGDGAELYRERIHALRPNAVILGGEFRSPRASAVCLEAEDRVAHGCDTSAAAVKPVYLRMSQPEVLRAQTTP
ncbi:MAG: tRNA (adenosine(37)-N6)-threonylcarbamoyltransferase complex dimerization subunit type 1 TsaB [Candidatus Hydrogenedentes bacterium]|nr:tRNA (adenosine(37)-N6)-threonylcarbamoyltransferase complex dimerization subunit type 1 TsaB [Candidatus Hydrogenedentota bacterium]